MVRIGENGRRRRKGTSSVAKVLLGKPGLSLSIALLALFSIYGVLLQGLSSSSTIDASTLATAPDAMIQGEPKPQQNNVKSELEEVLENQLPEGLDAKTAMEQLKKYKPRHRHISRSNNIKDAEQQKEYANEHHKQHRDQMLRRANTQDIDAPISDTSNNNMKRDSTDVASIPESDAAQTSEGQCLTSLSQLTDAELHPHLNPNRHFGVSPPQPSSLTTDYSPSLSLVCCHTSAGALSFAVHSSWAPIGSQRFLDMIKEKYFDNIAPIYRCTADKKACQFGLVSDPDVSAKWLYKGALEDDVNWLPTNSSHPDNARLVRRGYLIYAGYGSKSRSAHFLLVMNNTQFGDGADAIYEGDEGNETPWTVPFAELVGYESYRTLDKIFRGYQDGPNPMLLVKHGWNNYAKNKYPNLDFIKDCSLVEEGLT